MLTPDDSRDIAKAICGAYALLYLRVQAFAVALSEAAGLPFEEIETRAAAWIEEQKHDRALEASQWCFDRLVELGYVRGHDPKNPL